MNFNEAHSLLTAHGQSHLLQFFDTLSTKEQESLLAQIESLDLNLLDLLENYSAVSESRGHLEPLGALEIDEINARRPELEAAGTAALKRGLVGAVLLAGGQGTRLGYDKPKGMFNIGLTHELYIFECLIHNLLETVNQTGTYIPLYIMTSDKNHEDTVTFFQEKSYFGYDPGFIQFFKQDMAPSVGFDGRILLETKGSISLSPNGNGGWFSSLVRAGLSEDMKAKGVKWLSVFAVDNVLQRINDPVFTGAVIDSGCDCGAKVVRKANAHERVGVLCLEDKKPSIVEYYEMTNDMIHLRNEQGELCYNFGVILNYMFRLDKLEEILHTTLPVHIVEKKIPCIDDAGNPVTPNEPNGYKFEALVLDMIHLMDSCCSFEVVREKEFAPVKNLTGADSVDTARALLQKNGVTL